MKRLVAGGTCVSAVFALGVVALAQTPSQTPAQPQSPPSSQAATQPKSTDQTITISGCVQREADYRRAHNLGSGGAVGTGVGVGNEFVLIEASASSAAGTGAPATGTPTGTAGASAMAKAYELTGSNEGDAEKFVGRRVEIVGKLKAAEMGAAGPTGGATAGAPPKGVDVASKDLKLRELEVVSVREATGTCPPAK